MVIIAFLLSAVVILFLIARAQVQRADAAEREVAEYRNALAEVKARAERLKETAGKTAEVQERANEERQELARTADADLVHRANNLFGLPDDTRR
jgi:type II secretory pathway pseudopilin PulG